MRLVIAPDSFKGTLSARQAGQAIACGVQRACPRASLDVVPMADGGEGTVDAVLSAAEQADVASATDPESAAARLARCGLRPLRVGVRGPLGEAVDATYALAAGGSWAVIEMAAAAGLTLVPAERRDVMRASTYGVGQLLADALRRGAGHVLLGIGGSGTSDGGCGLAQALGVRFHRGDGGELPVGIGGGALGDIARIDASALCRELRRVDLEVLCDVDNPLCGPQGAAAVYAPQKGASPAEVALLDRNLAHLARLLARDVGCEVADLPGAGAAGGLGAGLLALTGARLVPGARRIVELIGLEYRCMGCTALITGEGRFDAQSWRGKVVSAVAEVGARRGVPVYVLAGQVSADARRRQGFPVGVEAVGDTVPASAAEAAELLAAAAEKACRIWFPGD